MLADLEDLDLSLLELDVLGCHILLLHDLDSDFLAGFLVDAQLDGSKLPISELLLHLIEIKQVRVPDCLFDLLDPFLSRLLRK